MNLFNGKCNLIEAQKYKKIFEDENAAFQTPQYMLFQARGTGYTASFYQSGKFVIQGHKTAEIMKKLGFESKIIVKPETLFPAYPHIGVDESGKGDFFGPLVIAGVCLNEKQAEFFKQEGATDSKKMNEKVILALAIEIKKIAIYDVVVIGNKKYNELYAKFKNLNKLLAWGHSTVIENILGKTDVDIALCDQFANENVILNALKNRGKNIKLVQMPRAEEDTAVACASILARAEFVKRMDNMSKTYNLNFPKGASFEVKSAAHKFSEKYGKEKFIEVAKTHFKTYKEVL